MARATQQRDECPAPPGACSHPDICASHGCAALEVRRNQEIQRADLEIARRRLCAAMAQWLENQQHWTDLPDDAVVLAASGEGAFCITAGMIREAMR